MRAGSADRDQAATQAALRHVVRERGDDARPGRRERVPESEAAAMGIEPHAVDGAERLAMKAGAAVVG